MSAPAARGDFVPSQRATHAPHVRSPLDVARCMRCVLWAALPCAAVAVYNAGHQAELALAGGARAGGWRELLLASPGRPEDPIACLLRGALLLLPLLGVSWLAGGAVERGFARLRGRRPEHVALPVIALLFTLSLPPGLALWQAALGSAFGIAIGKEIFGGFGRNFVNPVLVGLGFLYFAYPSAMSGDEVWVAVDGWSGATALSAGARDGLDAMREAGFTWQGLALGNVPGALGETSALACLFGAVLLVYAGVASPRILLGGLLGLALGVWLVAGLAGSQPLAALPWHWHLVTGSFAFGLVFIATDPVTSAATDPGRWLYGIAIGLLVVVIRVANPAHREGVLLAILLGNVMAPLLDRGVAALQMRWRRRIRVG